MAGFFQQFLSGAGDELFGTPYLKDYKHASKTFTTDAFGNAPKFKWLFHVYFDINKTLITDNMASVFPDTLNPSLLVKTVQLPKFSQGIDVLNQYNRKRLVMTKINYDPIQITFHDDNSNTILQLWNTYASYYFNDFTQPLRPRNPSTAKSNMDQISSDFNQNNIYNPQLSQENQQWGYNGSISNTSTAINLGIAKAPFFKSISIFGFNQHNVVQYMLINPVIENFGHDMYSYAETSGTMENTMMIRYESVKYATGAIDGQSPNEYVKRFGEIGVYDRELSPISRPGSTRSILGQGGLVDAAGGFMNDLANGNVLGAIQTAGRTARTFRNGSNVVAAAKSELYTGVVGALSNPGSSRGIANIPAAGAGVGTGNQNVGATNQSSTVAPPVSTPDNKPIG